MAETTPREQGYVFGDIETTTLPPGLDIYKTVELQKRPVGRGDSKREVESLAGVTSNGRKIPITFEHLEYSYGAKPWTKKQASEATPLEKLDTDTTDTPATDETQTPVDSEAAAQTDTGTHAGATGANTKTTEAAEETPAANAERETGHENYRREAIDPERIRELKDRFDREYRKELELHNIKTDEDRQKDPYLVKTSSDYVRDRILRDYLKIAERDWDPAELSEVRRDVIHMMELANTTLDNLMLKPEGETAAGTRTVVEPGPTVITPEPVVVEPGPETGLAETQRTERKGILARLGDKFRNGKVRYQTAVYNYMVDPDNERVRRTSLAVVVGASAIAGFLIGESFEHWLHHAHHGGTHGGGFDNDNHGGHNQHGGFNDHDSDDLGHHSEPDGDETGAFGKGSSSATGHGLGNSHEHIETWNEQNGHRFVQSIMPDNLEQKPIHGTAGVEHIVDRSTGQVIVDHVTYKGNRVYSDDTLRQIHEHGYNTDLVHNPIFDNDGGKGPTGEVPGGYASRILPKAGS